jgi:hypothetical protein
MKYFVDTKQRRVLMRTKGKWKKSFVTQKRAMLSMDSIFMYGWWVVLCAGNKKLISFIHEIDTE